MAKSWCALLPLIVLGLLLCPAIGADLDANGDGEVTVEEFLSHQDSGSKNATAAEEKKKTAEKDAAEAAEAELRQAKAEAEAREVGKQSIANAIKAGKPIDLDVNNAELILDGTSNVLLKFSTSWCGHCVKMAPEWASLAETIHKEYRDLKVVSVDCEKLGEMCQAFGVKGYPTVILLKPQKTAEGEVGYAPVPYEKERVKAAMLAFVCEQKAARAKNPIMAFIKRVLSQVFAIQVTMPK